MLVLLHSAEMHWRGKLRENSIRNLPIRFVQSNGTPHVRLNDPVSIARTRESHLLTDFRRFIDFYRCPSVNPIVPSSQTSQSSALSAVLVPARALLCGM